MSQRCTFSGFLVSNKSFAQRLTKSSNPPSSLRAYSSSISLQKLSVNNIKLKESLELFESNEVPRALEIALEEYRLEFQSQNAENILLSSKPVDESTRPAYTFLSSLLASLGPKHPETIKTIALMRSTHPEATPFKLRIIQKSHGGYPVRLNNGKWTWQGPHWSRHNNRTWKLGYSSDFTYGWGK
jgi:hypothetical protein